MNSKVEKKFRYEISVESLHYQDFEATSKIKGFSNQYAPTSFIFWTEFLMQDFDFVVLQQYTFEN